MKPKNLSFLGLFFFLEAVLIIVGCVIYQIQLDMEPDFTQLHTKIGWSVFWLLYVIGGTIGAYYTARDM